MPKVVLFEIQDETQFINILTPMLFNFNYYAILEPLSTFLAKDTFVYMPLPSV